MLKMYNYKNKVINGVMLVTILFNLMLALVGPLSKVVAETNNTTSLGDFGDSAGNTQADFYSGNTTKGVGKEILYDGIRYDRSSVAPTRTTLGAYYSGSLNDPRSYCTWSGRAIGEYPQDMNVPAQLIKDGDTISIRKYRGNMNTVTLSDYNPEDTYLTSIAKVAWLMDYVGETPEGDLRARRAGALGIIVHDSELEMNPFRTDITYHNNQYKLYQSNTWETDNSIKKLSAAGIYANEKDRTGLYAQLDALGEANKGPYGLVVNPIVQVGNTAVANFSYRVWNQGNKATNYVTDREQITATLSGPATFADGSKTKTVNVGTSFGPLTLTGNGKVSASLKTTRFPSTALYRYYDGSTQTMVTKGPNGDSLSGATSTDVVLTGKLKIKKVGVDTLTPYNGEYTYQGAQFGIYASKADAQNKANVLQVLTTGATGETPESNELVSGKIYYIRELVAPKGHKLSDDIKEVLLPPSTGTNVKIVDSVTGYIYHEADYSQSDINAMPKPILMPNVINVEDPLIKAKLRLEKKDAETGKKIPLAGVQFKIWDIQEGKYVTQVDPENTAQLTTTFKTDASGEIFLQKELTYGKNRYRISEVTAPENYEINLNDLVFSVDESTIVHETIGGNKVPVVTVQFNDKPAKSYIQLTKYFESLMGIEGEEGNWNFIWNHIRGWEGATFDVYVDKDITEADGKTIRVAPDGTRFSKDTKVATVSTDALGVAQTTSTLYVGDYYLVERKAPAGQYFDSNVKIPVSISFNGKDYIGTPGMVDRFDNNRQTVKVVLPKLEELVTGLDSDNKPVIGKQPGANKTFGLYNNDPIMGYPKGRNPLLPNQGLGVILKPNSLIRHYTTNTAGLIELNQKLPAGEYYFQESNAGENFALDTTHYYFRVADTNNDSVVAVDLYQKDANGNKVVLGEILNRLNPPKIGTTATDAEDGDKQLSLEKEVTVHDEVAYENLFTDRQYTLTGTLMNKATGQPLKDVTGHDVLVTKSFTPVTTKGSIGLDFTLDATHLANKDVVVFELLKETVADKEVAAHRDINDKGQTVHFEDKPKLPSTDGYPRRPLPMTGETQIAIGFFLSLIVSLVGILTRIKHKANKKTFKHEM